MANQLATTDEAIESLYKELKLLQSTTHQLRDAGEAAGQTVQAAEHVTQLSEQVMRDSATQLSATTELAANTTERLDKAIAAQQSFTEKMHRYIESDLQPQLARYQRSASINQWLLIITLLLVLANFGFVIWLVWLSNYFSP